MTKGYSFTVEDIDWSAPADLEPYAKAYTLEMKTEDNYIWSVCGSYILSAVAVAVERCLAGNKAQLEYIDRQIMQETEKTSISEEETQRAVDLFFAKENARRINWQRKKNFTR